MNVNSVCMLFAHHPEEAKKLRKFWRNFDKILNYHDLSNINLPILLLK
jgi:hypothetical protein